MIWYGINEKGENIMFIKKLLQQIKGYRMGLRRKGQKKQLQKNKNSRLAKLLNVTRTIK